MLKKRNFRKKILDESEEEDIEVASKLNETRTIQQLRKRQAGFSVSSDKHVKDDKDFYEICENSKALNSFSASTAKADDSEIANDPHMQKYIEEQLALRLGKRNVVSREENTVDKCSEAEKSLYVIPEELRAKPVAADDATVVGSVSTLSEVALPDESRMRNIQAVEAIKRTMLAGAGVHSVAGEEEEDRRGRRQEALKRYQVVASFGAKNVEQHKKPRLAPEEHRRRLESQGRVVRAPRHAQ
mmetsp:Transcript_12948/g.23029  ORF Transcript_12948/g.23029 Transcript_12948/m.23029 type:complete len:243 (-) Transcript_12948:264-992(-)|eukprot:CAMPEP_0175040570 /NCGR_PEP_ID=MMETSP0052_2-20121109/1347_1 /TAXON_ID=51329 ORGANISM="Polytomella parva, Strain SAG 63-3" /NCGR_SAMPLE_ID=MMETSP0052_2 /ASSEMBLY_ACC=CAM_ASM_000194 /LENGTH=242 /DNA_ID=CAMNT_0016302817 /DNA_START=169 /DNA_END=897 /DNA_ORIENTATION=+